MAKSVADERQEYEERNRPVQNRGWSNRWSAAFREVCRQAVGSAQLLVIRKYKQARFFDSSKKVNGGNGIPFTMWGGHNKLNKRNIVGYQSHTA